MYLFELYALCIFEFFTEIKLTPHFDMPEHRKIVPCARDRDWRLRPSIPTYIIQGNALVNRYLPGYTFPGAPFGNHGWNVWVWTSAVDLDDCCDLEWYQLLFFGC